MGKINTVFTCWTVTFLLILSAGCSYIAPGGAETELVPISSIGILPAQASSHLPSKSPTMAELETGVETINSLLEDYFQGYKNVTLISQSKLEGLPSANSGKYLSLAREAGQQLQYDAVLITTIERYQGRKGSEYSVKDPASVAFSLKLLAVDKSEVIWSADFDQTQQPLLENILPNTRSTGSGFRWLTAAELTSAGLTRKLNNCPYLKRD
jgi:hypothetical protein